ncbi:MAG: hypothetical protein AAB642_00565 [Patescibacteria group bacterium]
MAAQAKKYTLTLSEEDRLYIEFQTSKNRVTHFVIQYHSLTSRGWRTIIRYDTAHGLGVAHKDVYVYSRRKKTRQEILGDDFNAIFTRAIREVRNNWKKIKENYLLQ